MVDLEDTASSPPTTTRVVAIGHVEVGASASAAGRLVARVEGDGALEKNWGRQLGGIAGGYRGAGAWSTATWSQTLSDPGETVPAGMDIMYRCTGVETVG
jgi:hypothetical protein